MTERILVVDDQAPNIRLLEAVLTPSLGRNLRRRKCEPLRLHLL